ncbi:choice-of-anchor B family protein [Ascidiimonas sp. W6]|uniref:choice-of-anchor B family protein n=1 Tax=Ascidiimonas meishanensis TaxID=3128903 RepID=UPI0030EF9226
MTTLKFELMMKVNKLLVSIIILCTYSCVSSSDDVIQIDNPDPTNASPASCENGFAGAYPCKGYDLQAQIPLSILEAISASDIWGWTDSATNKEYAILALDNATVFIDISNPKNPVILGKLATATGSSRWRDVKVFNNHAFIVSEAAGHGMQIFDLTKLRNVANPPQQFNTDTNFTGFGNAHNVVINEASGFAYAVGTARNDIYNGGAHFVDISSPQAPVASGGFASEGYTHDAQVITYQGPDTRYVGKEIFLGSNESRLVIVDVTNKMSPELISSITYSNREYTHQGWFTEDQRYFLLGDELDEVEFGFKSRTLIFDLSDLENPSLHDQYLGTTNAIDHNGYVKGNEFFLANYTAGIRVLDISDIANKNISETGFFDTYPQNNNANFRGVWSVYPYFSSGNIIISDINNGFFIIRKSN